MDPVGDPELLELEEFELEEELELELEALGLVVLPLDEGLLPSSLFGCAVVDPPLDWFVVSSSGPSVQLASAKDSISGNRLFKKRCGNMSNSVDLRRIVNHLYVFLHKLCRLNFV